MFSLGLPQTNTVVIPKVEPSLVLTHPSKKRASPSNKFLEALDTIERAMYEAQATGARIRHSKRRLAKIKQTSNWP